MSRLSLLSLIVLIGTTGCATRAVDDGPPREYHAPDGQTYALTPVRDLPGLTSIDFWEVTDYARRYSFSVHGPELNSQVDDLAWDADIFGAPTEGYDVFYSDADGSFNADGAFLTIEGVYGRALPAGGALNLADIQLNTDGAAPEFGTIVSSYVALGDNAEPDSVSNCIDGDLSTYTTMGNTSGSSERMRITLGFPSTVTLY